ncbi:methionine adenosyltransferase, C-terminal domain protein, partial [Bordetella holmesii H620]
MLSRRPDHAQDQVPGQPDRPLCHRRAARRLRAD